MRRHAILTLAATAAIASGTTATAVSMMNPAGVDAAASDARVVRELKAINSKLGANYRPTTLIGKTSDGFDEIDGQLDDVYRALADMCRALGGDSIACPSYSH